jgi:Icc-related predicted phosphoesterase
MKILAIGDFHGKFPSSLRKEAEKADLILSTGDYCGNKKLEKLFFKYVYGKDEEDIPEDIKEEMNRLDNLSLQNGVRVIKLIKRLGKEFYGVCGNWDPRGYEFDIGAEKSNYATAESKKFTKFFNGKIKLIDFNYSKTDRLFLVGGGSSTCPGKIDKARFRRIIKRLGRKDGMKRIKLIKEQYKKREGKYIRSFSLAEKSNLPTIFITHNSPYRTKLDILKKGPQKGIHYGSYLDKEMIKKFSPDLVLCGHMHENQGKIFIGKSLVINPGAAFEGKAALIEFDEVNKKVLSVGFIR